MNVFQAFILGLLQGVTEFLPVSSSGHLEIGKALLGVEVQDDLIFTVAVHGATVMSTIVVFWKDIVGLFSGFFKFKWNNETQYICKICISMIPIMIVGFFFKDIVEGFFGNGLFLVGCMLLLTALLLTLAQYLGTGKKEITYKNAFVIGLAQACAVLPGLSRSGTTIATGLLLGVKREDVAKFSFLMVLIPILGENILSVASGEILTSSIGWLPLLVGTITAFLAGLVACKFMINIVKKGKLLYFAIYCLIVGLLCIFLY